MGVTYKSNIDLSRVSRNPEWYVVVTTTNYEKAFERNLNSGLKNSRLDENILDVFVPFQEEEKMTKTRGGKDKVKVMINKLYPTYVFVKAIMNERVWDYIRNTTGSATILASGGYPQTISEQEIDTIKVLCKPIKLNEETTEQVAL